MKRMILAIALGMVTSHAFAQDAAIGTWQTQPDEGSFAYIDMAPCGAAICGTIARTFDDTGEYQSENLGRQIVIDMVPQGDGTYEGSVWRPSNDRIYIGRMELEGNQLTLRGCVAGGLFCARQTWVRIN